MRAFQVTAQSAGAVADIAIPEPGVGEVTVRTSLAGICGTDVGLFNGGEERMATARTAYPIQLGHEWCGVVVAVGPDADSGWVGTRVTGDTMIGCGHCPFCLSGRHHVCANRFEIGVRRGWPGAFAEQFPVPVVALRRLPDAVDDQMGAMVEPGGNAIRAVDAALEGGRSRVLIVGAGTIGLLSAQFARMRGADHLLLARGDASAALAAELGIPVTLDRDFAASGEWPAVIDCTDSPELPAFAAEIVEPTGRVVLMGVSHTPSLVDTRVVLRKEATLVGILGASAGLDDAIDAYARGQVDPRPLIAETIRLEDIGNELAGLRSRSDARPKVQVDPSRV